MKKVIKVEMSDGKCFYSDSNDKELAFKAAKKYLQDHRIDPNQRPLTTFTHLEMNDEEYHNIPASCDAEEFWRA